MTQLKQNDHFWKFCKEFNKAKRSKMVNFFFYEFMQPVFANCKRFLEGVNAIKLTA